MTLDEGLRLDDHTIQSLEKARLHAESGDVREVELTLMRLEAYLIGEKHDAILDDGSYYALTDKIRSMGYKRAINEMVQQASRYASDGRVEEMWHCLSWASLYSQMNGDRLNPAVWRMVSETGMANLRRG
jgi:hypothetical protein